MGRNKYETNVQPRLEEIREWIGTMTEEQIAKKLGISRRSLENYKKQHKELQEAIRGGREDLVIELKETLKRKAQGYHYKETKTVIRDEGGRKVKIVEQYEKYAQPDTGAIHLLLKNLDETWRNDDRETMNLKRQRLEMEKEKSEANNW